jgi:hypothetical protein
MVVFSTPESISTEVDKRKSENIKTLNILYKIFFIVLYVTFIYYTFYLSKNFLSYIKISETNRKFIVIILTLSPFYIFQIF